MNHCIRTILKTACLVSLLLTAPNTLSIHTDEFREFSDSEITVLGAYLAFYGRPADPEGLAFWAGKLEDEGGNLDSIIDAFANSQEYDDRFGNLSISDLVANLFQQQFGRDPDAAGLDFYVSSLESGVRTLQAIAIDILLGSQNEDSEVANARLEASAYYIQTLEDLLATDVGLPAEELAEIIAAIGADDYDAATEIIDELVDELIHTDTGSFSNSAGLDHEDPSNPTYTMTLSAEQEVYISVSSISVDAYLYLLDEQGEVIAEDDDSGGDSNPLLQGILPAGLYFVVVATYFEGESGSFELEAQPEEGGVLNLRNVLDGPGFSDYASLGGSVTDADTGLPISGASIEVIGLISGYNSVSLYTGSDGSYFTRILSNRVGNATFNAVASAEGCIASGIQFDVWDANRSSTINFVLGCDSGPGGTDVAGTWCGSYSFTGPIGECTTTSSGSLELVLNTQGDTFYGSSRLTGVEINTPGDCDTNFGTFNADGDIHNGTVTGTSFRSGVTYSVFGQSQSLTLQGSISTSSDGSNIRGDFDSYGGSFSVDRLNGGGSCSF